MSFKNQRLVVTGGAGFIGSEVVRQLVNQEANVVVIDSLVNGKRENLEGLATNRVRLVVADIRNREVLGQEMNGTDLLIHMACLGVRHSFHSPEENHEVNATGTLGLLQLAREKGVKRFVYVSSSEVYGTARSVPMSEEHPTFPQHVYGAAKLAGECYARAFYESHRFPTVVVRPFNTYGPRSHHEGDSGEVIPKFMLRSLAGEPLIIFGDGNQTRDFTYVVDTARGILMAAQADEAVGETINLGSGREISINDLAKQVISITEQANVGCKHDSPRPGDVRRLYADITKAKRLLGFRSEISLREGIAKLHDWYLGLGIPPQKLLEEEVVHNWKGAKIKSHV